MSHKRLLSYHGGSWQADGRPIIRASPPKRPDILSFYGLLLSRTRQQRFLGTNSDHATESRAVKVAPACNQSKHVIIAAPQRRTKNVLPLQDSFFASGPSTPSSPSLRRKMILLSLSPVCPHPIAQRVFPPPLLTSIDRRRRGSHSQGETPLQKFHLIDKSLLSPSVYSIHISSPPLSHRHKKHSLPLTGLASQFG